MLYAGWMDRAGFAVISLLSAAFLIFTAPRTVVAQPGAQPALIQRSPSFDVAAIHLHTPVPHERSHIFNTSGRFLAMNESLKGILQWAFDIPASRIIGGPGWLGSTRFDIDAKAESGLDTLPNSDPVAARVEKRRMVQNLLAERFGLVAHTETRVLPIYVLVVAKSGPKFLVSRADGTLINSGNGRMQVEGGENTVALLAEQLAEVLGRVVVDKTGVEGRYKMTLRWSPDNLLMTTDSSGRTTFEPDQADPPLLTAIQEQLGLKLEDSKGPVEVLAIDHVEMPSEN